MRLLEKITAKDIASLENVSLSSAKNELREIKEYYSLKRIKYYHYLMFNKIDYIELVEMSKSIKIV